MKTWMAILVTLAATTFEIRAEEAVVSDVVLAIHGGIGVDKAEMTPALEKSVRAALDQALRVGFRELQKPDSSGLDAVEAAIRAMEDSPLFNAGKGAVFTRDGRNELDASIMEGKSLRAGAVASVTTIKNPITAARAVMEKSKHVLLVGAGADAFAREVGLEIVDPKYFYTEERWQQLQRILEEDRKKAAVQSGDATTRPLGVDIAELQKKVPGVEYGTVGAVARDRAGDLTAGTSTGGLTAKRFGRVGDSPILGAGTYADNEACAISATGHGEYFIRYAVAHDIVSLMKYRGLPVQEAAAEVISRKLKAAGGSGGIIALDKNGNFAAAYNTEGMYRGYVTKDGTVRVMLYEQ